MSWFFIISWTFLTGTENQQRIDSRSLNSGVSRGTAHHRSFSKAIREIANDGHRSNGTGSLESSAWSGFLSDTKQGIYAPQNETAISCERETSSAPTKMSKRKRVFIKPLVQNHCLPGNNTIFQQDSGVTAESSRRGTSMGLLLEIQSLSEGSVCLAPTNRPWDLLPLLDESPGKPAVTLRLFGRSIPIQCSAGIELSSSSTHLVKAPKFADFSSPKYSPPHSQDTGFRRSDDERLKSLEKFIIQKYHETKGSVGWLRNY